MVETRTSQRQKPPQNKRLSDFHLALTEVRHLVSRERLGIVAIIAYVVPEKRLGILDRLDLGREPRPGRGVIDAVHGAVENSHHVGHQGHIEHDRGVEVRVKVLDNCGTVRRIKRVQPI